MTPLLISRACAWAGVLLLTALSARAAKAPNMVFIEVDDLTYSYVGAFGNGSAKTPVIDRLANEGFRFTQAMAQGAMCGPSRNCLITGTYPHQLGFYQNGDLRKLPESSFVLPAALRRAGYHTAWIGKSHLKPWFRGRKEDTFNDYFGFDHSLHTLGRAMLGAENEGGGVANAPNPYTDHLKQRGLWDQFQKEAAEGKNSTLPEDDYLDGWFARKAVDFIEGYESEKPLFLWLNFSLPHGPYDVPDAYHAPFANAKVPGVSRPANYTIPPSLIERTKTIRSEKATIEDQRGYLAGIHYLDRQVGRIRSALEKKDMLSDTWIVFFSDQGVMLGSLGLLHKSTIFRQITQPSLIIRPPGGLKESKVIDAPAELTDLLPTALTIAGSSEKSPAGQPLQPLFDGKPGLRKHAFAEIEKWIAVSDGTWRLLRPAGEGGALLFNDRKDPENTTNLAAKEPEIVARLSKAIDEWLLSTGPRKPAKSN